MRPSLTAPAEPEAELDVFETFADRVGTGPVEDVRPAGRVLLRSGLVALGVLVLASAVFGVVFSLTSGATPFDFQVGVDSTFWEGVLTLGWGVFWGVLATAVVLAVCAAVIGVPWVRRQRASRAH